jgi:hypothetical protein
MSPPELKASDFSEYLNAPTDEDSKYAKSVYDHLAGFCLAQVCASYPNVKRGSARGGFRVISRLIEFAVDLYPEYADSQSLVPEPDGLRQILLHSDETPLRFGGMPNKTNQEVEDYFGLIRREAPPNLNELYRFEPNTARGTIFIADDDHFSRAYSFGRGMDPLSAPDTKCPMLELTKTIFWPGAVNLAADTPEVFAHSLGLDDN